jgi:hypothetical protein
VSWGLLRVQWHGWDHPEVLLSLVYRLVRCLIGPLAVLVRSDLVGAEKNAVTVPDLDLDLDLDLRVRVLAC